MDVLLGIRPVTAGDDCFEDTIATLCNHYSLNYNYLFANEIGFDIKSFNGCIGDAISIRKKENLLERLKAIYGYNLIKCEYTDKDEIMKLTIKSINNKIPIVTFCDCYWLPWAIEYEKTHGNRHAYIVSGYSEETNNIIVVDPTYGFIDNQPIPCKNYINSIYEIYQFVQTEKNNKEDSLEKFMKSASYIILNEPDYSDSIKQLSDIVATYLSTDEFKDCKNYVMLWRAPFLRKINLLIAKRKTLINVYKSIRKEYYEKEITEAGVAISCWSTIRMLLLKGISRNEYDSNIKHRIVDKFRELYTMEKIIHTKYKEVISGIQNHEAYKRIENKAVKHKNTIYHCLCLDEVYNLKAFSRSVNPNVKTRVGISIYLFDLISVYLFTEEHGNNSLVKFNEVEFKLPDIDNKAYDIISCNGQEMEFTEGEYDKIYLLAFSVGIRYSEQFQFYYNDNLVHIAYLTIPVLKEPLDNDIRILGYKVAEVMKDETVVPIENNGYLYGACIKFEKKFVFNKIKFPYNEHVCIASVTLC